jgi:hypothetical protein
MSNRGSVDVAEKRMEGGNHCSLCFLIRIHHVTGWRRTTLPLLELQVEFDDAMPESRVPVSTVFLTAIAAIAVIIAVIKDSILHSLESNFAQVKKPSVN